MAEKYFEDQFDDEEVLFVFRKHPIVMRKGLVLAMFPVLLGTLVVFWSATYMALLLGVIGGMLVGALVLLPWWMAWHFSVFIVTDQRLIQITQKGLFHRSVVDMGLNQIQMVNYEVAGLQETIFGFGTIMMQTFVGDLIIHEIPHPGEIQKKLLEILRQQGGSAAPYATTQDADIQQEMEQDET